MITNIKKEFSIIIPVIRKNNFLMENLNSLNNQIFKNFEVILISENNINIDITNYEFEISIFKKVKILTPGEKRNFGAKIANGEFLAFIDDDAYPDQNWLQNAKKKIDDLSSRNFILGGPGILPNDDNLLSKIIDLSFRSFIYGNAKLRYESIQNENLYLDDWPSVNMIIEKENFLRLKGFDENYWPGEDTKLCNKLINNNGVIIYQNNMIVKHYRRSSITKHIRQIFRYSFTRGKFFRQNDKNSKKIIYLMPTFYSLFLIIILFFKKFIFITPFCFFLLILLIESFFLKKETNLIVKLISPILILLNVFVYGLGFAFSFIFPNYNTKLGR